GIRVNAVGPGRTETPMIEKIANEAPEMVATWTVSYTHLDVYKRQA
ncbi:hypothetical protein PMI06_004847, partial [Burkholderia sp. BT03]